MVRLLHPYSTSHKTVFLPRVKCFLSSNECHLSVKTSIVEKYADVYCNRVNHRAVSKFLCALRTLLANDTASEIEDSELPRHGDRKGSPLLYTGLVSQLRACTMPLALLGSGCLALFLSFASKVRRRRERRRRNWGPFTLSPRQRSPDPGRGPAALCTPASMITLQADFMLPACHSQVRYSSTSLRRATSTTS